MKLGDGLWAFFFGKQESDEDPLDSVERIGEFARDAVEDLDRDPRDEKIPRGRGE